MVAESGPQALELLRGCEPVAVALVDLTMPGWSGERVCAELRTLWPGLPLVVMSGHSEVDVRERTDAIEGVGFLQKPFRRSAVADVLEQAMLRTSG